MNKIYSEKEKQKIVNECLKEESNISEIARKYKVARRSLYNWINDYEPIDRITYLEYKKMKADYERIKTKYNIIQKINCLPSSDNITKMEAISKFYKIFPVKTMCRILKVDHSTFYNYHFRRVEETEVQKRDAYLKPIIKDVFFDSKERFGKRKIVAALKQKNIIISDRKASSIMKELNLVPYLPKRKMYYPKNQEDTNLKNFLKQNFKSSRINEKWVSDVTYLRLGKVYAYLCVIIDLYSRKVIGYKVSYRKNSRLVIDTLNKALIIRNSPTEVIFHSDLGGEYRANEVKELLKSLNIKNSFSDAGNPYDNAVAESFFSSFKKEEANRTTYKEYNHLKGSINEYVNFYNSKRPHMSLGYLTPVEFEKK